MATALRFWRPRDRGVVNQRPDLPFRGLSRTRRTIWLLSDLLSPRTPHCRTRGWAGGARCRPSVHPRPRQWGSALPRLLQSPVLGLPPREDLSVQDLQPPGALLEGPCHAFDAFARRPIFGGAVHGSLRLVTAWLVGAAQPASYRPVSFAPGVGISLRRCSSFLGLSAVCPRRSRPQFARRSHEELQAGRTGNARFGARPRPFIGVTRA